MPRGRVSRGGLLRRGALQFTAPAPETSSKGRPWQVGIRPENVALHRVAASDAASGNAGIILDAIFKGSHIAYEIAAGDDRLHALTLPPVDGSPFVPGDHVRVTLPKGRIIVLAPEDGD